MPVMWEIFLLILFPFGMPVNDAFKRSRGDGRWGSKNSDVSYENMEMFYDNKSCS
jgi:hypothetical protein